jgi:IS1 family transposase
MTQDEAPILIIDEIFTHIDAKDNRYYIWTAFIVHDQVKYPLFHLSKTKTVDDLDNFACQFPKFSYVFSDKNPTYKEYFGKKNIAEKGIMTNVVESLNSQLRHYCSKLIRRSQHGAKTEDGFIQSLLHVFCMKLMPEIPDIN